LPYVERTDEEVIAAYERWTNKLSESDKAKVVVRCLCPPPEKNSWTVMDLLDAMKNEDKEWGRMPAGLRKFAKARNEDIVSIIDNWPPHL